MLAVGLMSGTSLDGVDAVLVDIKGYGLQTEVKVIDFIEYEMPEKIRNKIKEACDEQVSSVDKICSLNFELGSLFSKAVQAVLEKANVKSEQLGFIASHGQTICHLPQNIHSHVASTLQIGEPAIIAYEHNTPVISNFRTMDMASGGQGAPLVPYSEWILYSDKNKNIALQNIGGIGNVTVLNKSLDIDDIMAFDTGPGNMMINEAMRVLFNQEYDDGGKIAKQGTVIESMLEELMQHPYMHKVPPKSTGREEFGEGYVRELITKYQKHDSHDIVATFTMFTATSMFVHYQKYILDHMHLDLIVIGGGGAHNETLLRFIKEAFAPIKVCSQEQLGYSSDAKEAIAFALLGNETWHRCAGNVPKATGANKAVILGNITPRPIGGNETWQQEQRNMSIKK